MTHVSVEQRRARLANRHLLPPVLRVASPNEVADSLVALHSSDPVTVFLSLAARMQDPSIDAIEHTLYTDRSLLRHHAMRRTLWVMTPEIAALAHASSTRKIATSQRRTLIKRISESGLVDDAEGWLDHAVAQMVTAVAEEGPIGTRELGELLPELRLSLPYPGPDQRELAIAAHTKVIQLAGFAGRVVRTKPTGTWVGSQYLWTSTPEWLDASLDDHTTDEASAALLDKWLRRFGPGTEADIVWWTGWSKTQVRSALAAIDAAPVTLDHDQAGWLASDDTDELTPPPWLALLPGLDPTPMGWKDRSWFLADALRSRVFDRNGNVGPTIWVDGRIVGAWSQRADGSIATEVLVEPGRAAAAEIERESNRLREFIGDARFTPRFPTPTERALARSTA